MEKTMEMVSMDNLSIIDSVDVTNIQTTMKKISQLQSVVQSTLRKDHDYGIISGTSKPTLLKPGAEKILMLFGLTSEYTFLSSTEDYDRGFFAYTVKCILTKNGQKITEGVGQCNTYEGKYRWRWVTEKNLPDGIDPSTLQSRTKNGKYGEYKEYRTENDDPYTLANTVLKMAKKRAQVDAVLTVASLSEVFTQDLEDMRDFIQREQMENMTDVDIENIKIPFGKYKGELLGEIVQQDRQYIEWLSKNAKNEALRKASTEILLGKDAKGDKETNNDDGDTDQIDIAEFEGTDDEDLPF